MFASRRGSCTNHSFLRLPQEILYSNILSLILKNINIIPEKVKRLSGLSGLIILAQVLEKGLSWSLISLPDFENYWEAAFQ